MKEADPIKYGRRVRERRKGLGLSQTTLGKLSGFSQTHIGWIESGRMKSPHFTVDAISEALRAPKEWLFWGTGPKTIGPAIMSDEELQQNYNTLSPEDRAEISASIAQRVEAAKEKLRSG